MPQGTVKAVKAQKPWSGANGNFIDFTIDLESGGRLGEVVIASKCNPDGTAMKPPTIGETFEYEVKSQDQYGIKIKRVSNYQGGGNSDKDKSIARQTAAKCAAQVVAALVTTGKQSPSTRNEIERLTNEFYDAITAEQGAQQSIATDPLTPDTTGLDSTAPQTAAQDDSDIPF